MTMFFLFVCKFNYFFAFLFVLFSKIKIRDRRGHDRMVVGFTTTYAISAYHYLCCEFKYRSAGGVQHYVIKFVNDLRQVSGFLRVLRFPPPKNLTAFTDDQMFQCINQGYSICNIYLFISHATLPFISITSEAVQYLSRRNTL